MSKYCGKCDLWDSLVMIGEVSDDSNWNNIDVYQLTEDSFFDSDGWHNTNKLEIHSIKDLIPYAPFISCLSMGQKNDGDIIRTDYIGNKSFIDIEENERFEWVIRDARRICKSYKRKGEELSLDELVNKVTLWRTSEEYIKIICERVLAHPYAKHIKTDNLHTEIHNMYRKIWYNDMIGYGYSKEEAYQWCYHNNKTW